MATISSSGTWTALTGLTGQDTGINTPSINKLDLEDLKGIHGVVHEELRQFIQLVADAYTLKFWQGACVAEILLKALMNSEGPTQQNSYTP
jgi:chemotaxis protein CheY-P-specific phosphatase CheC